MEFEKEISLSLPEGDEVRYGFFFGGRDTVFIKSGAGGSHRGYGDKYVKMAHLLWEEGGYTVVCASNPGEDSFWEADRLLLERMQGTLGGGLSYIGASMGATQGLVLATEHFAFRRMLLINMPLMINFHKIKDALARAEADVTFVYGKEDPSHPYLPYLEQAAERTSHIGERRIEVIEGADHNFGGHLEEFIALGRLLLPHQKERMHIWAKPKPLYKQKEQE